MRLVLLGCLALLLAGCATGPGSKAPATNLVGAWRLISYEDRPAQGAVKRPYGDQPKGMVIYDRSGAMSIQIMAVPHPKVASGTDEKVTPQEKIALFDAYLAYFGTYTVDAQSSVVIHHVEGDIADVFIGDNQERPFAINGDTLALAPQWDVDGVRWTGIRVFERVK
jgi:lipocalin-like protein